MRAVKVKESLHIYAVGTACGVQVDGGRGAERPRAGMEGTGRGCHRWRLAAVDPQGWDRV